MRKILNLLLVMIFVFSLSACKKEDVSFKVIAPLGSPALAQTYMESTLPSLGEHVSYDIEIVLGTDPLVAAFGSETYDIIYAPTNLGAKLIGTGVNYQFAGTVVWGNLYLATSGLDNFTLDDLDGKEIVVFGRNATPDIILQTVLANHTFTVEPTLRYVDSANTAQGELMSDHSKIILIAEPLLSVLGLPINVGELNVIDLQDEWKEITGASSYPQAGIFVSKDLDKRVVLDYLQMIEISIEKALLDSSEVAEMATELEYGIPSTVLSKAIQRSNLMYKSASESRTALETYFGYILEMNGMLIGGSLPGDEFYFGD